MPTESRAASAAARNQKVEAFRKQERAAKLRRRIIIGGIIAVAVIIVIVIVVVVTRPGTPGKAPVSSQIIPSSVSGASTTETAPTRVKNTSGISGVLAWDTTGWPGDGAPHSGALGHDHVAGPVTYTELPPVGGPHSAIWMNAGVYTKPVPTERAVHNLEHGGVWITYNPNLSAADVKTLTAFVSKQSLIPENGDGVTNQSNRYIDLSPWASNALPTPIVISAWGYQLQVTSPTDARLQAFVDKFRNSQTYSPEFGGAVDGVPVQTGGRAASDGGTAANPPGSAQ
jgi:hypothetical protein